ncbi:hypothetical protein K3495_g6966 [Podosphaera aphanis]|nr:hypothetical protein K3495_g6966 [Podosphaera aphanis]
MTGTAYPDEIQLGSRAFNFSSSNDAEQEYDRLRSRARHEQQQRASLSIQSQEAYQRGDRAAAHELSVAAKTHLAQAEHYNQQASEYIFRENNAPDRVTADTIDLHGQTVVEAERILEARIRCAQQQGQPHLHVIVGKGNHSANHVQKIKPCVERVCQQIGLQYATEANAGRIYINLHGGPATMPPVSNQPGYLPAQSHPTHPHGAGESHPSNNQPDEIEKLATKLVAKILRKADGCCVMM